MCAAPGRCRRTRAVQVKFLRRPPFIRPYTWSYGKLTALSSPPPRDGIARTNAIFTFLMGALPTLGGSAIAIMLIASFVWEIISLACGRFPFRMTRQDRLLAWTFTAFAALIVLTALLGQNVSEAPRSLLWLLTFLVPWVLIPRLRASPGVDYLGLYTLGAATGAIAGCVVAFVQLAVFESRPEGGAGNADVFAMMSLCLMGLGGLNVASPVGARRWLGTTAIVAGATATVLSLTRGVAIMVLPMIVLLAMYAPLRRQSLRRQLSILLLTLAAALLAIYLTRSAIFLRWDQTLQEFQSVLDDGTSSNVGERLRIWKAAVEAIHGSPIWGYGIQNRMDVLLPWLRLDGHPVHMFSHPHNGFLSSMLDGGIIALAALIAVLSLPVVLAWQAPKGRNYRARLFGTLCVTGAYVSCGMTQIMFKHDIMDAFFVFFATMAVASIPEDKTKKQ
jgi:O-antigen ligase